MSKKEKDSEKPKESKSSKKLEEPKEKTSHKLPLEKIDKSDKGGEVGDDENEQNTSKNMTESHSPALLSGAADSPQKDIQHNASMVSARFGGGSGGGM